MISIRKIRRHPELLLYHKKASPVTDDGNRRQTPFPAQRFPFSNSKIAHAQNCSGML
jgi:hypothetical protein